MLDEWKSPLSDTGFLKNVVGTSRNTGEKERILETVQWYGSLRQNKKQLYNERE